MRKWLFAITLFLLCSLWFASCSFPGVVTTNAQLPQVSATPRATPLPPVRFPQDEAPHRDLTEWWYYTGHFNAVLPDGQTRHYGFEFVIFQALRSDLPPVYAAHFAITDVTDGHFFYAQRRLTEPNAVIPNDTSTGGFTIAVGDWTMQGLNGLDHIAAEMPSYALHFTVQALKPPVLHNGNGLISVGLAEFSYYYSRTRMAISGALIDHGQMLQVTGTAWMDHQWGNFLLLAGGGWDWFSIQLDNNTEMMLYFIRDAAGKIVSTYASYIGADAHDTLLPASALHMTVLGHWRSPVTGANYPSGWRLQVSAPQLSLTLTLTPELKDQELVVYQSTGNAYWEGAVSIQGESDSQPVQGESYVELTGYAKN